jgi:hypothetical protein
LPAGGFSSTELDCGEPHFRLLAKSPACPSCAVNHGPPGCHELQQKSSRVAKLRSCASTYKAALRIVSPQPGTLQGRRGKTAGYRARLSPLHLLTRQLGAESAWSTGARSPGSPQGQGCCTGDRLISNPAHLCPFAWYCNRKGCCTFRVRVTGERFGALSSTRGALTSRVRVVREVSLEMAPCCSGSGTLSLLLPTSRA